MKKLKQKIVFPLLLLLCTSFSVIDPNNYPVPSGFSDMLFYVQRSINKNSIVYQLNVNDKGELNEKEPISVFWVLYAQKNETEPLNYIQRKYAYGLNIQLTDKEKKTFCFHFVSYKKQLLYLIKSPDKKYHVFSYFNNRLMQVNRIYVHIEGGSFWTPKVKYIEVSGKDPIKNEPINEKIII